MYAMLAEIQDAVPSLLDKLKAFEIPTRRELVGQLAALGTLEAVALVIGGLACMLQGWKIFKVVIIVNAAMLGLLVGWGIGGLLQGERAPLFCGIAGGLLLAALAWPTMKYAISIMGAAAGGLLGLIAWQYVAEAAGKTDLQTYSWVGALVGLITLGLLALVIFKLVVMIFTSFQGALMAVSGVVGLLLKNPTIHDNLRSNLETNMHLLPLLVGVPALVGFTLQQAAVAKKAKKKRKALSGGDG